MPTDFLKTLSALIICFLRIKKPSPMGEGGTAKRWMRSCFEFRTPHPSAFGCHLPPLGKAIQFFANFARPFVCSFFCYTVAYERSARSFANSVPLVFENALSKDSTVRFFFSSPLMSRIILPAFIIISLFPCAMASLIL